MPFQTSAGLVSSKSPASDVSKSLTLARNVVTQASASAAEVTEPDSRLEERYRKPISFWDL